MKRNKTLMCLLIAFAALPAPHAWSQIQLKGKKFTAQTGQSCIKTIGGGSMLYEYCVLEFKADSVDVYYMQKTDSSPERETDSMLIYKNLKKTFAWEIIKDTCRIIGFNDYGVYVYRDKQLIAIKEQQEITRFKEDLVEPLPALPEMSQLYGADYLSYTYKPSDYINGKCSDPGSGKIMEEVKALDKKIAATSQRGYEIDPQASYKILYTVTYSWNAYAGNMRNESCCAEKQSGKISGKKLGNSIVTGSRYDEDLLREKSTWLSAYGEQYLIVVESIRNIGNATESGSKTTYYYEKAVK